MSGGPARLDGGYSREMVNGKEYFVSNSHFCPAYYDGEDWGIVVLAVTNQETNFKPYYINSTNTRSQSVNIQTVGETFVYRYEKNFVTVCYNDESGNCYCARLEMNDPKIACLFYRSNNKNRTELIDLWYQLNKEKDNHSIIFEVP